MKRFFIISTLLLLSSITYAQTINVTGAWEREDDKMRTLSLTKKGNVQMDTEEGETYIYYRISENLYQMNWTPNSVGGNYRWTMRVVNDDTIVNLYEVQGSAYSHERVYKRLFF